MYSVRSDLGLPALRWLRVCICDKDGADQGRSSTRAPAIADAIGDELILTEGDINSTPLGVRECASRSLANELVTQLRALSWDGDTSSLE